MAFKAVHLHGGTFGKPPKLPRTLLHCHFLGYLLEAKHARCGCSWIGHALPATESPTSLTLTTRPLYLLLSP